MRLVSWAIVSSWACSGPVIAEGATRTDTQSGHCGKHRQAPYSRSLERYEIPALTLINQDGEAFDLAAALDADRPVALTFIFTTCTTICPVMTATFRRMQQELGNGSDAPRLISISIDPEFDTPAVLRAFADRYRSGPGWEFLTGNPGQVTALLKAFDAHFGDKMNHRPLYFFKLPDDPMWLRIEGLAGGQDMVREYRELALR